jgi:cytochrome P450
MSNLPGGGPVSTAAAGPPVVGGCPFDPRSAEQLLDPYPWLAEARHSGPVFHIPEVDEWWVTRYEDCLAVLRDTATYSSRNVIEFQPIPGLDELLPDGHPFAEPLVNADPPEHTRLRRLAQQAFTPRAVAAYEPEARAIVEELIDGFIAAGSVDLFRDFAQPLTMRMVCGILGVPRDDVALFKRWMNDVEATEASSPPLTDAERGDVLDRVVRFDAWIREFIEERRVHPREDLTSSMISATADDGSPSLTTWETVCLVVNILSAGFDTSASLIGTIFFLLLSQPERWERLKGDPSLIPAVVEETLRFDNPARSMRRFVTADTVLAGVEIPRGATVIVSFDSAMHDETVFADPNTFDPDRADLGEHFGLGRWTHFCLGAPLVRMEAKVAVECMLDRLPQLQLADGEDLGDRHANPIVSALRTLQVQWDLTNPSPGHATNPSPGHSVPPRAGTP